MFLIEEIASNYTIHFAIIVIKVRVLHAFPKSIIKFIIDAVVTLQEINVKFLFF